jgi:hypothetical protein
LSRLGPSWTTSSDLRATGPTIDIRVAVPQQLERVLRRDGAPVPRPRRVSALVDTGAHSTVISPAVVRDLGLHPVDRVAVETTGQQRQHARYRVRCLFPPNDFVVDLYAIELDITSRYIEGLVGRDVLAHADLVYEGRFNRWSLTF